MVSATAFQAEDVGSIPITRSNITLWGRAVVACKAHNLEVGGSTPPPATNMARYINWLDSQIHNLKVSSSSLLLAT